MEEAFIIFPYFFRFNSFEIVSSDSITLMQSMQETYLFNFSGQTRICNRLHLHDKVLDPNLDDKKWLSTILFFTTCSNSKYFEYCNEFSSEVFYFATTTWQNSKFLQVPYITCYFSLKLSCWVIVEPLLWSNCTKNSSRWSWESLLLRIDFFHNILFIHPFQIKNLRNPRNSLPLQMIFCKKMMRYCTKMWKILKNTIHCRLKFRILNRITNILNSVWVCIFSDTLDYTLEVSKKKKVQLKYIYPFSFPQDENYHFYPFMTIPNFKSHFRNVIIYHPTW